MPSVDQPTTDIKPMASASDEASTQPRFEVEIKAIRTVKTTNNVQLVLGVHTVGYIDYIFVLLCWLPLIVFVGFATVGVNVIKRRCSPTYCSQDCIYVALLELWRVADGTHDCLRRGLHSNSDNPRHFRTYPTGRPTSGYRFGFGWRLRFRL